MLGLRRTFFAAAFLMAWTSAIESSAKARFVYGGDMRFAPFDYRDAQGLPTGFNVELLRRLAREAGVELEVRLDAWNDVRAGFDEGRIDIVSLSYSEERVQTYEWLGQTWWMHQCVLFRTGRPSYPQSPSDLAGETVAVQERSAVAELLFRQVPPKPSLLTVRTQDDALAMLERGMATGVGGNSLSLRVAAANRGMGPLVETPLRAVRYGYMARKGRSADLDWVRTGLTRLHESGAIEALAERFLAVPSPRGTATDTPFGARTAAVLALGLALVATAALRSRARQAAAREEVRSEHRMRSALALADAEWQRTVDAVDTCVLILDGNHRIRRANRAARALIGLDDSVILDRRLEQLSATEPWLTAVRLLETSSAPLTAQAADGATRRTWNVTVFRSGDPHDVEHRVIVAIRDVTRVLALRGALRNSARMSALGSLVAGVAHEIRNPLFSISACLDALEDEFGSRAEYAEFARPLRSQVGRLTQLTRDLLDYGRTATLKPTRIEVGELLGVAVAACAALARERGVQVRQEVGGHVPPLEVDAGRMGQVLENLIANAVQHSPRGSVVQVSAQDGPAHGTLELAVADQGLGLADDDIPHLFEPFFSRREGGTGLGLSIVQRIVESHGGRITAANQRGGGAVFTVTIPTAPPLAVRRDARCESTPAA